MSKRKPKPDKEEEKEDDKKDDKSKDKDEKKDDKKEEKKEEKTDDKKKDDLWVVQIGNIISYIQTIVVLNSTNDIIMHIT